MWFPWFLMIEVSRIRWQTYIVFKYTQNLQKTVLNHKCPTLREHVLTYWHLRRKSTQRAGGKRRTLAGLRDKDKLAQASDSAATCFPLLPPGAGFPRTTNIWFFSCLCECSSWLTSAMECKNTNALFLRTESQAYGSSRNQEIPVRPCLCFPSLVFYANTEPKGTAGTLLKYVIVKVLMLIQHAY